MRTLSRMTVVVLMSLAAGLGVRCEPQSGNPVIKVHAYEREVIGGIPGGGPGGGAPQPMRYLIYLETAPDAKVAVDGVWIKGTYYAVESTPKQAPIKFESPVVLADEAKNYAVPPTTNAVTEVVAKTPVTGKTPDAGASHALRGNDGALQITSAGKTTFVPITKFERRDPIYLR